MQACGTWSRYWNEEEAHHETVFGYLTAALQANPPDDLTIIEYRKIFPDDDMLRTLTLLACSEISAAVTYNEYAHQTKDAGLKGAVAPGRSGRGAAHALLHLVLEGARG